MGCESTRRKRIWTCLTAPCSETTVHKFGTNFDQNQGSREQRTLRALLYFLFFLAVCVMAQDDGTEPTPPLPPPGDDEQQTRLPRISLKTPPKREDIPSLHSTLLLMKHEFSSRQRQCLAHDKGYQAIMVRVEAKEYVSSVEPQDS